MINKGENDEGVDAIDKDESGAAVRINKNEIDGGVLIRT